MTQHFLISSASRDLKLRDIYQMTEPEAFERFCELRWASTAGEPVCPDCGSVESYRITTRRQFKCRACHRQYSPTSGTILSNRKMRYVDLLAAICIFSNAVKGISSLQLARDGDTTLPELIKRNRPEYVAALQAADASIAGGRLDLSVMHGLLTRLIGEQLKSAGIDVAEPAKAKAPNNGA